MIRRLYIICIMGLLSCTAPSQLSRRLLPEDISTLPTGLDTDAPATVLFDKAELEVFGSGETGGSLFKRHRSIYIHNARGMAWASVAIPFGLNSRIQSLQARTITADGRVIELQPQEVYEIDAYPQFIFYSDRKAKLFAFPGVEAGSTVEYAYTVQINDPTLWPAWSFQEDVPVLNSEFSLVAPAEWPMNHRIYGDSVRFTEKRVPQGFKSTYTWKAGPMAARRIETAMPTWRETCTWLSIAPENMENWRDVSTWYNRLSEGQTHCNAEMKRHVQTLVHDAHTPEERLQRLFEWVRDHIRYVAVSVGIGSFQPHAAEETFRLRYGDCKDMSTLLAALAREAGVTVYPALISTRQNGPVDTTLATTLVFNHMIAWAPEISGGLFMDATAKGCPFGQLPWGDQGASVLLTQGAKATRIMTSPVADTLNQVRRQLHFDLHDHAGADLHLKIIWMGAEATIRRNHFRYASERALQQWILSSHLPAGVQGEVEQWSIEGLNPIEDPLILTAELTLNHLLIPKNNGLNFNVAPWLGTRMGSIFIEDKRVHPVVFSHPKEVTTTLLIDPPAHHVAETNLINDTLQTDFGVVFLRSQLNNSVLKLEHQWRITKTHIAPDQYQNLKSFFSALERMTLFTLTYRPSD